MAGAYIQEVRPFTTVNVALPPADQSGGVRYGATFLSLATDFGTAVVRLAIGRPGDFRIENNLQVPVGRQVVRRLRGSVVDQVASIVHLGGPPVSVLVEFETRPDF
jgi:hypothetical protein